MAMTLHRSKDKLVGDLKSLISDAEELLKLTADQQGGKLDDLRARIGGHDDAACRRIAGGQNRVTRLRERRAAQRRLTRRVRP